MSAAVFVGMQRKLEATQTTPNPGLARHEMTLCVSANLEFTVMTPGTHVALMKWDFYCVTT